MGDEHVLDLIEEAVNNQALRKRVAHDRTAKELAESANKEGFGISKKEARKILAGAYLTSDELSDADRQEIIGGLAWDFLDKVEDRLDRDFGLLAKRDSWERAKDFYENVFAS